MTIFWEIIFGILIMIYLLIARMEWRIRKLKKEEYNTDKVKEVILAHEEILETTELMETLEDEMEENPFSKAFTRQENRTKETTKRTPFRVVKNLKEL